MPWRTLCGFPPTADTVTLRVPNGAWRPDTVITDYEGTEMFVLLDQTQEMRSYEAVFGDLEGRRLVCIKRHVIKAFWKDGYYFCTYRPNYPGQMPLKERDIDNKKVYPFSYLQVNPMKGRFFYRYFDNQGGLSPPKMRADNPWLGFMVVCCTPMVRCGKWTASFKRRSLNAPPTIHVDQWRNCVDVGPGNDVLAALCMAYVFDRYQCQPLVTVFGMDDDDDGDDKSINTHEPGGQNDPLAGIGDYGPPTQYKDQPRGSTDRGGAPVATDNNYNSAAPPPASYDPSTGLYYDDNGQPQQYYDNNPDPYGLTDNAQYYDNNNNNVGVDDAGQYYDNNQPVDDGQYYDNNNNNNNNGGLVGPFVDENGVAYDENGVAYDPNTGVAYDDNGVAYDPNTGVVYDDNGVAYDPNGQPGEDGQVGEAAPPVPYYDDQGNVYYVDEPTGQVYFLDEQGQVYYLDEQTGQPYYLDEQGQPYYIDDQGMPYYIDQNGKPYYVDGGAANEAVGDQFYDDGAPQPGQQQQAHDLLDTDNNSDDGRTRPALV